MVLVVVQLPGDVGGIGEETTGTETAELVGTTWHGLDPLHVDVPWNDDMTETHAEFVSVH